MENSQSVPQDSLLAEAPTPNPQKNKSKQAKSKNSLIHLLANYPLILPIGLSASFLCSGVLALYSLGYVGRVEPEASATLEAEVVQPIKAPSETPNPISLGSILAIALSCGSGSLVLFLLLNRSEQRQKLKNHINRYQTRLAQSHQKMPPRPPQNSQAIVPPQITASVELSGQAQPVVTILPPEPSISSKQNLEPLANMFDIRKDIPLSTILRKDS